MKPYWKRVEIIIKRINTRRVLKKEDKVLIAASNVMNDMMSLHDGKCPEELGSALLCIYDGVNLMVDGKTNGSDVARFELGLHLSRFLS